MNLNETHRSCPKTKTPTKSVLLAARSSKDVVSRKNRLKSWRWNMSETAHGLPYASNNYQKDSVSTAQKFTSGPGIGQRKKKQKKKGCKPNILPKNKTKSLN